MPRNFVICCDGTSNQFSANNTNVVRLVQVLKRDLDQHVYYDPGVGTFPEPGWVTAFGRWISDLGGLAFGAGLAWKVQEAYCYLMNYWEQGDRVFLFGFGRGAYTVRVLAGLLHELGLLSRGADNLVPYAIRLFKTAPSDHQPAHETARSGYWKLRDEFRRTLARPTSDGSRRFSVHFVGLWDTVSSVGWVWDPARFPFTAHNPGIGIIRHAVSVDERRWFFLQNLMEPVDGHDLQQVWVPGVHCDVGGGCPESRGDLWRLAFEWMLTEGKKAGLRVDQELEASVLSSSTASTPPWTAKQNESLTPLWWPAEFFPKLSRRQGSSWPVPQVGLGRHRRIRPGELMQKATLLRIRDTPYAPPNLSNKFLQHVRTLTTMPDALPYEP